MIRGISLLLISGLWFTAPLLQAGQVSVQFPNEPDRTGTIRTFESGPAVYISTNDFVQVLTARIFMNPARSKLVIYFGGHRIKVSANSSFIVIDDQVYQMPSHALFDGQDIYLPMRSFLSILHRRAAPGILYDDVRGVIIVELLAFNLTGITIEDKANGR